MSGDTYTEKLAQFKENEKPEVILLVADDPELIRIIIAWTNMTVSQSGKLTKPRGDSRDDIWEWLWKNTKYLRDELATKSGVFAHHLHKKLERLVANRVLYPDGTINSFVQRYLREKVLKLFNAKPRRAAKPTPR